MKVSAKIIKQDAGYYKLVEGGDKGLSTLFALLRFGPFPDSYIAFLNDNKKDEFYGNVANLQKNGDVVTIEIEEYQFPGLPLFTIKIENLLSILNKWKRLEEIKPNVIELISHDGIVSIA